MYCVEELCEELCERDIIESYDINERFLYFSVKMKKNELI